MTPRSRRWIPMAFVASVLPLAAGCSRHDSQAAHAEHPATIEKIEGSELSRVTLTEKAAQRIDAKTTPVREQDVDGTLRKVVPYSSLIYDAKGRTWVYTSPQPRTLVRQQVEIDRIEGDSVFLLDGPVAGTEVASMGVTEIYGAETWVGH